MEGHVGEHHQILTESKECVNSCFTVSVVASEEVESQQAETAVEEKEAELLAV